MKKITEMIYTPQLDELKQKSLLDLSKKKHIIQFFKEHHLDTSLMNDYWVELLDYDDDYQTCLNCRSLSMCPKESQGLCKQLAYYDDKIIIELKSCPYAKVWEDKRHLLSHFEITNVNEELLLTDLDSLSLLKKNKLTKNEILAIQCILKYVKEPMSKGYFLHGDMGVGKTTLLAGLMNSLANKGQYVGFIHFPTFLIDLKASFTTGDNQYSIDKLMKVDYLLLDDIGEENVTPWSRDEILLTILSYRLLNNLPTFFTSMYGYNDLKKVYTLKKGDEIRANTLISKMKALSLEIMLDGEKFR